MCMYRCGAYWRSGEKCEKRSEQCEQGGRGVCMRLMCVCVCVCVCHDVTQVRFDFFCKAALEFLLRTNRQPDILHCHDWSTAHVAKARGHTHTHIHICTCIHRPGYAFASSPSQVLYQRYALCVFPTGQRDRPSDCVTYACVCV